MNGIGPVIVASGLLILTGCANNRLETGYEFQALDASPTRERQRAYFANQFSPEARAAQAERSAEIMDRRAGRGGM